MYSNLNASTFLGVSTGKTTNGIVTQVYPESGNMGKVLPEYLSKWTLEKVKSEGVHVITNSYVKGVKTTEEGKVVLNLNTGKEVSRFVFFFCA